jgi:quinol-cytochrome oxidoreductase complex cytochrome b subunit
VHRVRRWAFIVLGADFAALAVVGIWLAFRYEPGDSGASGIHAVLGIVAMLAALVAAIATVADDERSTAGILPAIVVLGVIAGLYLTGPTLGWDRLAANGPTGAQRGITVVFDKNVGAVAQGDKQMTAQTYRRYAWLHAVALPVAVLAMGGAGIWAARRRRSYVPQRTIDLTAGSDAG